MAIWTYDPDVDTNPWYTYFSNGYVSLLTGTAVVNGVGFGGSKGLESGDPGNGEIYHGEATQYGPGGSLEFDFDPGSFTGGVLRVFGNSDGTHQIFSISVNADGSIHSTEPGTSATGVVANGTLSRWKVEWNVSTVPASADGSLSITIDGVVVLSGSGYNDFVTTGSDGIKRYGIWNLFSLVTAGGSIFDRFVLSGDAFVLAPVAFANEPEIDLVWSEITDRADTVHVISEVDLPDRDVYFHGLKLGLLTEVGEIDRALSDRYGEHNVPSFTHSWFDEDNTWRALAAADTTRDFAGMAEVFRGVTDAGRRAEATPRVLFRGKVREHHWPSDQQLQVICEDPLSAELAVNNDKNQIPKAQVNIDDFTGCAATLVPSSAESYVVNGAHSSGATTILVRSGVGQFANGDSVSFGSDAALYSVSSSSKSQSRKSVV